MSGRARYVPVCVASRSGAFFAAPECGNAAAGGAAEIATRRDRHPLRTMHLHTALFQYPMPDA